MKRLSYKDAGVDIDAGEELVGRIKPIAKSTFIKGTMSDLGGFSGLFEIPKRKYKNPVLVSGTDGVGTKIKIAIMMDKHDTIGIDAVAMCVDDVVVTGAEPVFFLDYIATAKMDVERLTAVIKGIAEGCKFAGCSLLGGETAEHPGMMKHGEYDIAGFAVGIAEKNRIITGENIKKGDAVLGFLSSGLHSNGYSLARKVLFSVAKYEITTRIAELGKTVGEELLMPTKIYCRTIVEIMKEVNINGIAHITGGGIVDNVPRILPEKTDAVIEKNSWTVPPIFNIIQKEGLIENDEMNRVFNMGIGMVIVVDKDDVDKAVITAKTRGETLIQIGEIKEGAKTVRFA